MFDFIPEMLYFITKTILMLVDGFISIANLLCGIEPIYVDGEETNFLQYILFSEQISFAIKTAMLLGFIVVVFATIFQMLRNLSKEGVEGSPLKVCFKALKTLMVFIFVPVCMFLLIWIGNEFVLAMYKATANGGTTLGAYLFTVVGELDGLKNGAKFLDGTYDYRDVDLVWTCIDLWDYNNFLVWILGGLVIYNIITALMSFVDRVVSIVILYICAPFSVASSVIDDGSHFKLWRDQVLVKFFSSYGMIIALNIFIVLSTLVIDPNVVFFQNSFLNFCMKVMVIIGGALGLNRSMGLVGNLISSGAGSNELRDAAQTSKAFTGAVGGVLGAPFSPFKAIGKEALNQKKRDLAGRALNKLGIGIKDNGQTNENGEKDKKSEAEENKNSNSPNYNNNKKGVSMAISSDFGTEDSNDDKQDNDDNQNDNKANNTGQNLVNQAISSSNDAGGEV